MKQQGSVEHESRASANRSLIMENTPTNRENGAQESTIVG